MKEFRERDCEIQQGRRGAYRGMVPCQDSGCGCRKPQRMVACACLDDVAADAELALVKAQARQAGLQGMGRRNMRRSVSADGTPAWQHGEVSRRVLQPGPQRREAYRGDVATNVGGCRASAPREMPIAPVGG